MLVLCDQGHVDVHRDRMFSVSRVHMIEVRPTRPSGPSQDNDSYQMGLKSSFSLSNRGRQKGKREKDILPKL